MSERRVLVLADNVVAGRRIAGALQGLPVETHVLLCNNQNASGYRLGQALVALRHFPLATLGLAASLLRGRLHVTDAPLQDESVLRWLKGERFWVGLHAMGVIYRKEVLASFERGLLNSHIGLLPEYKGRSVMEWSLLAGAKTGITVFFMDEGIDTGRDIVLRKELPVSGASIQEAKDGLFARDGEMYRLALERLLEPAFVPEENQGGRRYYVMSNLLRGVVSELLR